MKRFTRLAMLLLGLILSTETGQAATPTGITLGQDKSSVPPLVCIVNGGTGCVTNLGTYGNGVFNFLGNGNGLNVAAPVVGTINNLPNYLASIQNTANAAFPASSAGTAATKNVGISGGVASFDDARIVGTATAILPLQNAGITTSVFGLGLPGLNLTACSYSNADYCAWMIGTNPTTSTIGNPHILHRIRRDAEYNGGNIGDIYNTVSIENVVGPNVKNYEGAFIVTQDQYNAVGGGVAIYGQMRREIGSGSGFASTFEARDYITNPITGVTASEMDLWGAGADGNGKRGIANFVAGRIPGDTTSTITEVQYGLQIGAQNNDATQAKIYKGITFNKATWGSLISSTNNPTALNGIDWTGVTFSGAAIATPGFLVDGSGSLTAALIKSNSYIKSSAINVSQQALCNSSTEGALQGFNDSGQTTYGAIISTGGNTATAGHVLGYCNGTNWTVH